MNMDGLQTLKKIWNPQGGTICPVSAIRDSNLQVKAKQNINKREMHHFPLNV